VIEVRHGQTGFAQAKVDCACRESGVVLLSRKSLLLGGGDDFTIDDQRRRRIMVEG
jgi:hypothetical protein